MDNTERNALSDEELGQVSGGVTENGYELVTDFHTCPKGHYNPNLTYEEGEDFCMNPDTWKFMYRGFFCPVCNKSYFIKY